MKVIYKYNIDSSFFVPKGSKVLCVRLQNGVGRVWVLREIEDENEVSDYILLSVIGTGQEFNDEDMKYIGTYEDGSFIWHVFQTI